MAKNEAKTNPIEANCDIGKPFRISRPSSGEAKTNPTQATERTQIASLEHGWFRPVIAREAVYDDALNFLELCERSSLEANSDGYTIKRRLARDGRGLCCRNLQRVGNSACTIVQRHSDRTIDDPV